jgi:hypothetical protein
METTITPLEALTEEEVPRPELTPLDDVMSQRMAQLAEELSDAEAYDAQILAGLVSP